MNDLIYADMICDWPLGYMEYYDEMYRKASECYCQKHPTIAKKITDKLYSERWHFARRILKTHSYCIPKTIIYMKLKKFVKEVVDKVLAEGQPKQLEFNFN